MSNYRNNGDWAETATVTNVGDETSSTSILAANPSRKGAFFYNASTAILYLLLSGGTAANAAGGYSVALAGSGGTFTLPIGYTGAITGIWASDAGGFVNITEFE